MKPFHINDRLQKNPVDISHYPKYLNGNQWSPGSAEASQIILQSGNQRPFQAAVDFGQEPDRPTLMGMLSGLCIGACIGAGILFVYSIDNPFFLPILNIFINSPPFATLVGALAGAVTGGLIGGLLGFGVNSFKVRLFEARLDAESIHDPQTDGLHGNLEEIQQWKRTHGEYRKI